MFFTFCNLLKQSVTSHKFYQNVVLNFRGYGVRYLFVVSFVTTLLYMIFALYSFNATIGVLRGEDVLFANNTKYIVSQLPSITIEENKLEISAQESPYYIRDLQGRSVVVFDTENQIVMSEKEKIPVVVTSDGVMLNILESQAMTMSMHDIGVVDSTMSPMELRAFIAKILDGMSSSVVFIVFPIMLFFRTILIIFDKIFLCIVIYFVLGMVYRENKARWQTALRTTIFVSMPVMLCKPLLLLPLPGMTILPIILQFWTMFLLGKAMFMINLKQRAGLL